MAIRPRAGDDAGIQDRKVMGIAFDVTGRKRPKRAMSFLQAKLAIG